MAKKLKFERDTILGVLSLVFLLLEIYAVYIVIQLHNFQWDRFGSVLDYIIIVIFGYTTYKTLIKKEKLKKWEFYLAVIAFIILLLSVLAGFLTGYFFMINLAHQS